MVLRGLIALILLSAFVGCEIVEAPTTKKRRPTPVKPTPVKPTPVKPTPVKPAPKPAPKPRRPWGPGPCLEHVGATVEGGPVGPNGEEVMVDIPFELRAKNVGGRDGAGLCVFTSIMHSAREQNEARLWDFQTKMRAEPGGGYPDKVDAMIAKYGPGTDYVNYEGSDPTILELALKTGRSPSVFYNGHDCHYDGTIAHMVNLVYLDSQYAAIMDNNFIGENQLVWMTRQDFLQRWTGGRQGWAVVLLSPRPPAPPHN